MDTTPLKPCPFCGGTVRFHSAGDERSEEGLEEWAEGKFGIGGRYTGKLYGNTDWALARVVWSAALSANHSEQGGDV